MKQAFVDQFSGLELGLPESAKKNSGLKRNSSHFFIRLITPPFPFSSVDFDVFYQKVRERKCEWEIASRIYRDDSYLGHINLGTVDGCERYMDEFLYTRKNATSTKEKYLIFKVKNDVLQAFKNLAYAPAKDQEIHFRMESFEFIPFRAGMGFLSTAFSIISQDNIPFRFAVDANYYLPFLDGRAIPLVQKKRLKDRTFEEKQYYIPSLLESAWGSLGKFDESGVPQKIVESYKIRVKNPKIAGTRTRLPFMSFGVLAVENKDWESPESKQARHYYHQATRWSRDDYIHDIEPVIMGNGPEKTSAGTATRFYAFNQDNGITCMGLGASEFERNNYLPKFRESYFFTLLLAWHIKAGILEIDKNPESLKNWLDAVESFPCCSFSAKEPRQRFFQDCLEFYRISPPILKERIGKVSQNTEEELSDDKDQCLFHREGEFWKIVYQGKPIIMKDSKGIQHIAYLLRHPGKDINVLELYHHGEKFQASACSKTQNKIDDKSMQNYKKKLSELEEEKEEACQNNDLAKMEKIDEEMSKILGSISAAKEKFPNELEKPRKTILNAIKRAYKNIQTDHPSLTTHFENSIKTGIFCRYQPEREIFWDCQY